MTANNGVLDAVVSIIIKEATIANETNAAVFDQREATVNGNRLAQKQPATIG